jgi:carboxypeptidase family protein
MGLTRAVGIVVVVAAALGVTRAAPAAPDGTAVIAGQVVSEWGKSGSTEPNPNGIAGATVEVVAVTWPSSAYPPLDSQPAPALATATTAADGTFRIANVPAGNFGLIVRGPGIATTPFEGLRVVDGAVYRGFQFACRDKAVEFASKVVRKDGGPVGGLEIVAWKTGVDTRLVFGDREVVRTKTAADGSFRLSGTVDHPEVVLRTGPKSYLDLAVRRRWGDPPPATIKVGGDAALEVLVNDPAGKPVPGARVRLLCDGLCEGRTSAEGKCAFTGASPGGFVIVADAPGLAAAPVVGAGPSPFGEPKEDRFEPLQSGRNERTLVLAKACTLTGTVVDRAGGAPVSGARVRFVTAMSAIFSAPETTTDSSGRFMLRDLPAGGGVVVVEKDWWRQTDLWSGDVWAFVRASARGEKRTGDAVQGPTVLLASPGAAVDGKFVLDRYTPLAIEVRDTSGKPVVGAHVAFLRPKEGGLSSEYSDVFYPYLPLTRESYADERGRTTADVDPAGAEVFVDAPGFGQWVDHIEPSKTRASGPKVFVMERYAVADVRVIDAAGKPVAGAFLWASGQRRPGENRNDSPDAEQAVYMREREPAIADAAGKLRWQGWPGPVLVVAGRLDLLGTAVVRVNAPEGGPTTLDVKLVPVASIEGRVTLGGKPPKNARIRMAERLPPAEKDALERKPQMADAEVRADGTFHVDSMLTGRVAMIAYVENEAKSEIVEADVKAGAPTVVASPLELHELK